MRLRALFHRVRKRCPANHAVIAMIGRAFLQQNPFVVWGTGEQVRNWTYVSDIVEGTIRPPSGSRTEPRSISAQWSGPR